MARECFYASGWSQRSTKWCANRSARSSKCSGANAERISCCKPVSKTLNGELGSVFKRWYPDLQLEEAPQAA